MTKRNRSMRKLKKKSSGASGHATQKVLKHVSNGEMPSAALIEEYLSEAEAGINTFNYEEASQSCQKVLELDAANVKALEMLASIHIENGSIPEAQAMLMRCVELCPDDGYPKYFSLAQLASGGEAVNFYQKGIMIMKKKLESPATASASETSQETPLHRVLSDAYCSVAELYMTDCCFEDDAENICKKSIESAVEADESNPDAHQCWANLHLVKGEIEASKAAISKSLSLWLPEYRAIWEGKVPSGANESFQPPGYDSRINTSKMLIELEMLDEANEVLEGLVAEDDEVVEIWYLLGWSHYLHGDVYKKNAAFYFKKAQEVFKKIGVANEDQMAHIDELLEELADIQESEESDGGGDNFPSESEESDTENCDVEMKQDDAL